MPGRSNDREHGEEVVGGIDLGTLTESPSLSLLEPARPRLAPAPEPRPEVVVERQPSVAERPGRSLKSVLIATDALALAVGVLSALVASGYLGRAGLPRTAAFAAGAVVVGLFVIRSQGLFLARVSVIRVVEVTRVVRAVVILAACVLVADQLRDLAVTLTDVVTMTGATAITLLVGRSSYRRWLSTARERGLHCRRVVLVGADEEAARLHDIFATHPDLGIRVAGVVGSRADAHRSGLVDEHLGPIEATEQIVRDLRATGVVVVPSAVAPARLNELVRALHTERVHVHVGTGMSGIDGRRVRSLPLAYEPLLYVEPVSLGRVQVVAKRAFDLVIASIALVIASPVMLLVAAAIKLDDGGPVLFRQVRVGRDGRHFALLKFRSMRVDAEKQLAVLRSTNERQGPLFKMVDDPRVTRVGRFLRESSLDELPQLFNVLARQMSLVGPRPALPAEVALFPASLRARERVLPGITGLWQVEARDNPSFEAYRRLDLFYVENWSTTLDLLIIVATVEQTVARVLRTVQERIARGRAQRT